MQYVKFFVILTLYFVYCRCEEKLEEDNEKEEHREGKQLLDKVEHGGWRTINPQEWRNSDEWIPTNSNSNEYAEKPLRRRRIRKRKRRPPTEDSIEFLQHKVRPHTLEDADESWMEMDEESIRAPHNRRRVVPAYLSDSSEHDDKLPLYEKVRDPFTALQEVEAKSKLKKKQDFIETTTMSNLKAILKQTGGNLNLSELLQRKNLSLSDLLKGKQHAISALTEQTEINTEPIIISSYKTMKPTNSILQSTKRYIEVDTNPLEGVNDVNDKTTTTPRMYTVITEPTTEQRIFVPSYPKIIPFHYKHSTVKIASTIEPVTISSTIATTTTTKNSIRSKYNDYRTKYVSLKPKLQNSLPLTSAKLLKFSSKPVQETTTSIPLKAFTIDLREFFGFSKITPPSNKTTDDAPLRMVIKVDSISELPQTTVTTKKPEQSTSRIKQKTNPQKLKPSNAREEIMEVLKDQKSRQNLSRILENRNMTIEELVAQRERGSSQIHLADIFHNQTREPEPPSEPYVGIITGHMSRKPKTLHNSVSISKDLEKQGTNNPFVDLNTLEDSVKNDSIKPTYTVTSFPTYKIAVDKILKQNEAPPFQLSIWKTLYPNLYSKNSGNEFEKKTTGVNKAKVDEIPQNDIRRVEDVANTISEAGNHKLNVEINENYFEDNMFTRLPGGVKSAIIASTALVAVSLLVFLTILIICKWSSKKKKRLCYSDAYSSSRIKSPILETRPKRTIRTIMNETLGRKKSYSNAYPQNISDYFWESDKKPFQ